MATVSDRNDKAEADLLESTRRNGATEADITAFRDVLRNHLLAAVRGRRLLTGQKDIVGLSPFQVP
jgi:hypothetical protein